MTTAAQPLQQGTYTLLTGDADLMAAITEVRDSVEGATAPFVVIGDVTEVPDSTHDREGLNVTMTLHIWSRYRGWKEALVILGHLDRVLHRRPFPVDGFQMVSIQREWHTTQRDPDPEIRHLPVRFRVWLEEE